jgi:translation initiation factor 2 gamma subunit (eIF-2gamma)
MEHERGERQRQEAAGEPERRGLELLPQLYLVTVEDRERRVDLVPLHRALQAVAGIDEITLVSFANGIPVVSLRARHEIDMEQLRNAVQSTLKKDCELIPQDNGRVYLRLTSREKMGV